MEQKVRMFAILHKYVDGKELVVDTDLIEAMSAMGGYTAVFCAGGAQPYNVKESPRAIMKAIQDANN